MSIIADRNIFIPSENNSLIWLPIEYADQILNLDMGQNYQCSASSTVSGICL